MSNTDQHVEPTPQGIEDVVVMFSSAPIDWAERLYAGEKQMPKEPTHPVDPDLARAMRVTARSMGGVVAGW